MLPTICVEHPVCEADISRNLLLKFVLRNGISIKDKIASFPFRSSFSNTPVNLSPVADVTISANTPFLEHSGVLVLAESQRVVSTCLM
jgi:hypothetical protein